LKIEKLESINLILREQLHDIKNHLQVTLGFIQLKKYDLAEDYIRRVMKEQLSHIKDVEKINAPEEIKILLSSKMAYAENNGIDFNIDIKAFINSYKIDGFNLTRILNNMLVNAFFAAQKAEERSYVNLIIWEDKGLNIKIKNNGENIPDKIQDKIFKPGFTTKGEKGDGMGLYIVKKLISMYKGKINLVKSNEETIFIIVFPEKLKKVI
jgi:sensor histidine kinase regulating citrate/malate metabolism